MRYFDIIFDGTQKVSGSVGPTMQWNGRFNTSLFGRHLSMKPWTPAHHEQQINLFWLINWNYKIQRDSEGSRPFQGFQELMCPSLTQALLFQSKKVLLWHCSTVRSYYKMAWFYGYALSWSIINQWFWYSPVWSLLNRVLYVPPCQGVLRANVLECYRGLRTNVPTCQHTKSV